jgi:hypothetical protein
MNANQHAQHPDVRNALAEIRIFAGQMQEMTALFTRAQADMTRQLSATTIRLDKAVETVAMGEARIAAQIALFDRMSNDVRRSSEAHERDMRDCVDRFQRTASELATQSVLPLRNQVSGILNDLAAGQETISAAATGLSASLETAVRALDANAADIIGRQRDAMASQLNEAMQGGEASFSKAREALDHSAGALANRIWATAEAQDTKMMAFGELTARLESLSAAVPDPSAFVTRDVETSRRMDETSKALNLAASKIIGAVVDMQVAKNAANGSDRSVTERIDALAGQQAEIVTMLGGLTGLLDSLVIRTVEDRNGAVTDMFDRVDQLRDSVVMSQPGKDRSMADEPAALLKAAHGRLSAAVSGREPKEKSESDARHSGVRWKSPGSSTHPKRGAA